jgi:hypothetical protein
MGIWIFAVLTGAIIIALTAQIPRYCRHRDWEHFSAICANVNELKAKKWELVCQCLQRGLNGVDVSFRHFGTGLFPIPVNLF